MDRAAGAAAERPAKVGQGDYEFIGSKNSYFSAKVRACLQYKRIPYSEVCANVDTIRRVVDLTGKHMYPVVVCPDGTVLQDGCDIVEALEARHPERPVLPDDPVLRLLATLFETWADEFMLSTSIYFRWGPQDTSEWAKRMFVQICSERVSDPATRERAMLNGDRIANSIQRRMAGRPPEHVERSQKLTRELCTRLDRHLATHPFLLGDRPSLADIGMMNAMFGHLYRDPGELCDHIHWNCISLALWTDHMLAAAGESDRGELFVAPTLEPVLAAFGEAYAARARAVLAAADAALPQVPIGDTPRSLGSSDGDAEMFVLGSPYVAWKLQRVMDRYRAIPAEQRPEADRWLEMAGFLAVAQHQPSWRLAKQGFDLVATHA